MVAEAAPAHQGHVIHHDEEGLLGLRRSAHYNEAEQRYSTLLYRRIEELLKGQRNSLLVLRRYPSDASRLGVMSTPVDLDRLALRIPIIEKMAMDALVFLSEHSTGGPVAQETAEDGRVVETRKFPTKFPHIIIERVDVFRDGARRPDSIEWCARRVQNQRTSTRINRMLDAANLGVDLVKLLL